MRKKAKEAEGLGGGVRGRPTDVSSLQVECITVPDKNIVCGWAKLNFAFWNTEVCYRFRV